MIMRGTYRTVQNVFEDYSAQSFILWNTRVSLKFNNNFHDMRNKE